METLVQDVRRSIRLLIAQRGFTLVAILTIALGIGASTAIFSVIDAAVLRPLPHPRPEQLVEVWISEERPGQKPGRGRPSIVDVRAWRSASRVFSHLAVRRGIFPDRVIEGPELERVAIEEVTEDYFGLYGIAPRQGRALTADDMRPEAPAVALVSYAYWHSRHAQDPDLVGRTLRLDGVPTTVVGVLPEGFGRETPIWRPLRPALGRETSRGASTQVVGRLRPGLSPVDAATEMARIARAIDPTVLSVSLPSMLDLARADSRTTIGVLTSAVAMILLIACVNVAGLLLARGSTRQSEVAIRASLGANRWRLVRQLLTESLVLTAAGGIAGVLIAWVSLDLIVANIPMTLPPNTSVALNLRVLGVSLGLTVITGATVGLLPALRLSRVPLTDALARGSRRHGTPLSRRGGQWLIGVEVALVVVLLAGAGLMIRSFARILSVDLGFQPQSMFSLETAPLDPAEQAEYYPALLARIRTLPGVQAAGATDYPPLISGWSQTGARAAGEKWTNVGTIAILPGYFDALGTRIRQGRDLTHDEASARAPVAIINESAARLLFGSEMPIGRRLEIGKPGSFADVVGVVGDIRPFGPLNSIEPQVYRPFAPSADKLRQANALTVVVRTARDVPGLPAMLRDAAASLGSRALVGSVRSADDWIDQRVLTPRRRTVLLSLLGGLGLILTLVGVLGMTSYAVAKRTQEIGVRMAFGARPGQVVGQITRDSAVPIGIGVAIGLGGAYFATAVIKSFLFETTPTDPVTLLAVAVVLTGAGVLAAWIPARRAARVDPVAALRAG